MPAEKKYISKITLPNGVTYEIKDLEARDLISQIIDSGVSFIKSTNASNTPLGVTWDDHGTTITGTLTPVDASTGKPRTSFYLVPSSHTETKDSYAEYKVVNVGSESTPEYVWEKIGDTEINFDDLGDLAWKDDASGTITVTTADSAAFSSGAASVSATYTPAGGVSSTFTGTAMTSTGSVTATGTVSTPTITITPTTTADAASKLKTAGSVTAGTAPSYTRGTFSGGSFTQGTDQFTAPSLTAEVAEGSEILAINFSAGSFTQGTDSFTAATHGDDTFSAGTTPSTVVLPTFDSVDLLSSVSATSSQPTFTGNSVAVSVSGTPEGSVGSTFTGTEATISSTGTASGTVTLTKTPKDISVTVS
jgi:hypothetical protein